MRFPAITIVTADIMRIIPAISSPKSVSPNNITPNTMAVTGSNTPSIAVGVLPMFCIASDVKISDRAVGISAKATVQAHVSALPGNINSSPQNI